MAEDAARELPNLPLEDALQLVHLYAERGSPKYERAASRWLARSVWASCGPGDTLAERAEADCGGGYGTAGGTVLPVVEPDSA